MEENKINEIGKMSLPAKVCCIIKAIGSYWSFAAPFVSALSDFQNYKQNRLIEDVLKKAFTMIEELDNRVRNVEYMNSQEFICDLLRTVDYSKNEIDLSSILPLPCHPSCFSVSTITNPCLS